MTHPNLQFLLQQFDHLYDAVEGGAISRESALQQLSRLQVPDGTGALWGVDAEGNFIRRAHPDAPPLPADAAQFVEARVPGGLGAPGPGGLGAPGGGVGVPGQGGPGGFDPRGGGGFTPPAGAWGAGPAQPQMPSSPFQNVHEGVETTTPPSRPAGGEAFGGMHPGPGPGGGGFDGLGGFASPPALAQAGAQDALPPWERESGGDTGMSVAAPQRRRREGPGWREKIAGRERLLIVVGVCLAVLIGLAVWGPRGGGSDIPSTSPSEGVPSPADTLPSDSELPSDGGEGPAPPAPAAAAVPSIGDSQRVITALVSKKRELASAVVAQPGDPVTIALETARYAGYGATGIVVVPGPAAAGPDGAVVQEWVLTDTVSKAPVGRTRVSWVQQSGWKLASWPVY